MSATRRNRPDLHQLSHELKRPVGTLYVLTPQNDPFHWIPSRIRDAEWFGEMWTRYGRPGLHPHGLHYVLVSLPRGNIIMPSTGKPYENTLICDMALTQAARDARYLGLVSPDEIPDRRNGEAVIHHSNESVPADGFIADHEFGLSLALVELPLTAFPDLPSLVVMPPKIPQAYIVELWIEKSTMAEVIDPIAQQYGVNVVSGTGQTSETRCRELVERAQSTGKKIRILYVSDFDPSGDNMPLAAARKMEFWIRTKYPDVDVQLRPIALTKDQCIEYRLPRTPIKEDDRRKDAWEEKHGEGATELDALEAIHPGVLGNILTEEIERYYDDTLQDRIDEVEAGVDAELDEINAEVHEQHKKKIKEFRAKHAAIAKDLKARIKALNTEFCKKFESLSKAMKPYWDDMAELLDGRFDFDDIEWPEPDEADEDADPLFDSTRDYVEQVDRFKQHQGRPITRKPGSGKQVNSKPLSKEEKNRRSAMWRSGRTLP